MIPASHISFNDDGTAWYIPHHELWKRNPHFIEDYWKRLDRPCDNLCGDIGESCDDCINGRHTFTIEIDGWYDEAAGAFVGAVRGNRTLRVSVVPDVVLPIYDECPDEKPADHICHAWAGGQQSAEWWYHRSFDYTDWTERQITLPPAAEPGMWAVQLQVHS